MQARTCTVDFEGGKLVGRSRAGEATSFSIPNLKWVFDCGALVQGWKAKIVFLTHTHSDHVHFLTHLRDDENPPLIYLPEETVSFVKAYLIAYHQMIENSTNEYGDELAGYNLRPTRPNEEIAFQQGNTEYIIRTLKMNHRVTCLGYSIYRKQRNLKEEYRSIPGKQIAKLKQSGADIMDTTEEPFICFMGDTTSEVFQHHPEILEHKTILIECSFLDEKTLDRAKETMHMHWNGLRPIVESHPDTLFLLTHFSLRYTAVHVRQFFGKVQRKCRNVHPMLIEGEVGDTWRRTKQESKSRYPKCYCQRCRMS